MRLYTYFRSSTSYRVRIALNLKGLSYEPIFVNLKDGEQKQEGFLKINSASALPVLETSDGRFTQSLAIIDYLESKHPEPSFFLLDVIENTKMKELAYAISTDIHAINNLRVLNYLSNELKVQSEEKTQWYRHWIDVAFEPLEHKLSELKGYEELPFGKSTLFEIVLIPQVYNALRFDVEMSKYPRIMDIYNCCLDIEAFKNASPEIQPDA